MWKGAGLITAALSVLVVAEVHGQQCTPAPSAMDFYFPYDGTWSDAVNSIPASQVGTVTGIGDPWGQPPPNEAIRITPISYVEFPDHAALDVAAGDFSIDAWVRIPKGASSVLVILDKRVATSGQGRGYMFYINNGRLGLQTMEPPLTNRNIEATTPLTPDVWHMVAATVDRSNRIARLYVDGQEVGVGSSGNLGSSHLPQPSVSLGNSAAAWVGRGHQTTNERGTFEVNEIELFHRVLPDTTIERLARGPKCKGTPTTLDVVLGPGSADNPVNTTHTVTATVSQGGTPQAGVLVTFTVTSGPHQGMTATALTDAAGKAAMNYPGNAAGTDQIEATATIHGPGPPVTVTSNTVTKTWIGTTVTEIDPCCPPWTKSDVGNALFKCDPSVPGTCQGVATNAPYNLRFDVSKINSSALQAYLNYLHYASGGAINTLTLRFQLYEYSSQTGLGNQVGTIEEVEWTALGTAPSLTPFFPSNTILQPNQEYLIVSAPIVDGGFELWGGECTRLNVFGKTWSKKAGGDSPVLEEVPARNLGRAREAVRRLLGVPVQERQRERRRQQ